MATAFSHSRDDRLRHDVSGFQRTEPVAEAGEEYSPLFDSTLADADRCVSQTRHTLHPLHAQPSRVLAQIPDVAIKPRAATPAPCYPSEIRFDPPQPRAGHNSAIDRSRLSDSQSIRKPPTTGEIVSRFAPAKSRVLPTGNPFDIPRARLQDRVQPIGQFLLLFVLFTAAGTSLLLIGGPNSEPGPVTPTAATVDAAIGVPTAATESHERVTSFERRPEPSSLGPAGESSPAPATPIGRNSATGPSLAAPAPRKETIPAVARVGGSFDTRPANPQAEDVSPSALNRPAEELAPGSYAAPYPTTDFPDAPLPEPIDTQLPQVRTSDAPPAVARFRGDIHAIPPR